MGRRVVLVLALGAVAFGVWAFYRLAETASRGGQSNPLYCTRRYDPYGTAALCDLLAERGIPVKTLERPSLDEREHGVLIQVLECRRPQGLAQLLSGGARYEVHVGDLREWIAAGNTVVQFSRGETPLAAELSSKPIPSKAESKKPAKVGKKTPPIIVLEEMDQQDPARKLEEEEAEGIPPDKLAYPLVEADWVGPSLRHPLVLRLPEKLPHAELFPWKPLARWRGDVVAAEARYGKGRLVVVGAPTPALNSGLDLGGNLEWILDLVGQGPVLVDDWSHGIGHEDTLIGCIREIGLTPVLFQLAFVLGLYLWSTRGHRRPDRPEVSRSRSIAEQIETLGYLYRQALSREEAVRRVRREVLRRVAEALGCSPEDVEAGRAKVPPAAARRVQSIRDALAALGHAGRRSLWTAELAKILTLSHDLVKENPHGRKTA